MLFLIGLRRVIAGLVVCLLFRCLWLVVLLLLIVVGLLVADLVYDVPLEMFLCGIVFGFFGFVVWLGLWLVAYWCLLGFRCGAVVCGIWFCFGVRWINQLWFFDLYVVVVVCWVLVVC